MLSILLTVEAHSAPPPPPSEAITRYRIVNEGTCDIALVKGVKFRSGTADITYIQKTSEEFWQDLDRRITDDFQKHLDLPDKKNPYVISAKRIRDHHARYLKLLGVDVEQKKVSSVQSILKAYEAHMKRAVENKEIDESDIMHPVFIFETPKGLRVAKRFGEPIEAGLVFYDDVLDGPEFTRLRVQGLYPMGAVSPSNTSTEGLLNLFEHDLAHLTSFMQHKRYMKAVRHAVEHRSCLLLDYFFGEGAFLIDPNVTDRIREWALLPSLNEQMTVEEVEKHLLTLSEPQIHNLVRQLRLADIHMPIGGANRDPINYILNGTHSLYEATFRAQLTEMEITLRTEHRLRETEYDNLSRMLLLLQNLAKITIEDWAEAIENESVRADSPILIFNSRLWGQLFVPSVMILSH